MGTPGGNRAAVNTGSPSLRPKAERAAMITGVPCAVGGPSAEFSAKRFRARLHAIDGTRAPWDEEPGESATAPGITLEPGVVAALAEWQALWGDAPQPSRLDQYLIVRDSKAWAAIGRVRAKHITPARFTVQTQPGQTFDEALAEFVAAVPTTEYFTEREHSLFAREFKARQILERVARKRMQASKHAEIVVGCESEQLLDDANKALDSEMRELHGAPPLPQDLQDRRNVASVIAAVAGRLSSNARANFDAAAKANQVKKESEGTPFLQLDKLLTAIRNVLASFEALANKHGVVLLDDDKWLRKVTHDVYLERSGLLKGVIVMTQAPTGTWITTINGNEIREWLSKTPDKTAADTAPAGGSTRDAQFEAVEHTPAVDEIGEYAKSAGRMSPLSPGEKSARQSLKNLTESADALMAIQDRAAARRSA